MIALVIIAACAAPTANSNNSTLSIKDAWARPTAGMGGEMQTDMTSTEKMNMDGAVSAIYMTIENSGETPDRLVSVNTPVANVAEIHETYQQDGGLMGMRPVQSGLEIPAKGTVALKPGSYHIMLMGLKGELSPGQTITAALTFQSGKQMNVNVAVKAVDSQ